MVVNSAKNEQNRLPTSSSTLPSTVLPQTLTYSGGPAGAGLYTYNFTVPLFCIYFEVLLVGGGGHGGTEDQQTSTLSWSGGGGGAGGWARARITNTQFIAGTTQYELKVGSGAVSNASQDDAQGGSTSLRKAGVDVLVVTGGTSSLRNQFVGEGGVGGTVTVGLSNVMEYAQGEKGKSSGHIGSVILTQNVYSGDGGRSPYGNHGLGFWLGALFKQNGNNASGFGAGGSGAVNDHQFFPGTFYGGSGATGYASVSFYFN